MIVEAYVFMIGPWRWVRKFFSDLRNFQQQQKIDSRWRDLAAIMHTARVSVKVQHLKLPKQLNIGWSITSIRNNHYSYLPLNMKKKKSMEKYRSKRWMSFSKIHLIFWGTVHCLNTCLASPVDLPNSSAQYRDWKYKLLSQTIMCILGI